MVRSDPTFQVFERRRRHDFNRLTMAGQRRITTQIDCRVGDNFWDQPELGWNCDLPHQCVLLRKLNCMFGAKMQC